MPKLAHWRFAREARLALQRSWRRRFARGAAVQDDPDDVDSKLSGIDPKATVTGEQKDLHVDLVATTTLNGDALRHRLRLLAGGFWQLKDVTLA